MLKLHAALNFTKGFVLLPINFILNCNKALIQAKHDMIKIFKGHIVGKKC